MNRHGYLAYGLHGRWIGWRNAILASPGFQRFAQRFPLMRPIARRRARAVFDLVAGFTYSQILAACVETGLLGLLAEGPRDARAIAARLDLPLTSAERLLRGAASLRLVERLGAVWALGEHGAALLGNAGICAMVAHHRLLYADLADPVALLRRGGGQGTLARHWRYADRTRPTMEADVASYSDLMAASQGLIAHQTIDAYPFGRHRRVLDIGGGDGAFLRALAVRVPDIALGLLDVPAVVDRARITLDAAGLASRATLVRGDFLADPLPTGYDLVTLIRVLHDHDDAPAMVLLGKIHEALPVGGRVLIVEPMAGAPGAVRMGDGYFGFYLLAMGSGRPRSATEIRRMLGAVGFTGSRDVRTAMPLLASAIVATR